MGKPLWEEIQESKIVVLSVVGSLASILGLGIVLIDKASSVSGPFPPESAWRLVFFVASLVGTAGALLFTIYWSRAAFSYESWSPHRRVLSATARAIIGLLLVGAALDGVFSTVYWTRWLWSVPRLLWRFMEGLLGV